MNAVFQRESTGCDGVSRIRKKNAREPLHATIIGDSGNCAEPRCLTTACVLARNRFSPCIRSCSSLKGEYVGGGGGADVATAGDRVADLAGVYLRVRYAAMSQSVIYLSLSSLPISIITKKRTRERDKKKNKTRAQWLHAMF